MSNRKVQQDIEKCFKAVAIGVEAFDEQYKKYEQSTNASQRDKLVEAIKKECKKLQRLRDQIKTWAAGNDVKDKGPLLDKRELIETKMEAFKAVEKEQKTKAFSKEGLSSANKLDPREKEKDEIIAFLTDMIDSLGLQLEKLEAETDTLQAQVKKSRKDNAKAERVANLEETAERHRWHQSRLELLLRSVENDKVEGSQVKGVEEDIKNYVENNQEVDFYEDDTIYDDFNLDAEEDAWKVPHEPDKSSSQENHSNAGEPLEQTISHEAAKPKAKPAPEIAAPHRRPSQQIKSPLPTLATLHTIPSTTSIPQSKDMKPAPPPAKPPGEPLKYASAAAAAAASDKAGIGIAPLPAALAGANSAMTPSPSLATGQLDTSVKSSAATSPAFISALPSVTSQTADYRSLSTNGAAPDKQPSKSPDSQQPISAASPLASLSQLNETSSLDEPSVSSTAPASNGIATNDDMRKPRGIAAQDHDREVSGAQSNGFERADIDLDKSIYHLPASLRELVSSFEAVRSATGPVYSPAHQTQLAASYAMRPDALDAEAPRHYRPKNLATYTPPHYPQDPLPIFDDPRLYAKIDTDSLFYSFYYRQGSYQQYLAAKSLKNQSWRFHKQYQTWFQRHEEPKNITEDFEQGTYRFFDYESTWMNRRKADFKFAYKFLEDDL